MLANRTSTTPVILRRLFYTPLPASMSALSWLFSRGVSNSATKQGTHKDKKDLEPFDTTARATLKQSPDPGWTWRSGIRDEAPNGKEWKEAAELGWKTWDTSVSDKRGLYKLLVSAVIPRPIAFVSTLSADGIGNLAPFSYFSLVSHNPPLVSVSFSASTGGDKDSLANIRATRQFTVNIISEPFAEAANATSIDAPPEVDEFDLSGLTREPSTHVKPPRVRESAVSLECELYHVQDLVPPGETRATGTYVLGHILAIHVRNAVLAPGGEQVDPSALRPIARLGGITYSRLGDMFEISRPPWSGDLAQPPIPGSEKEGRSGGG